jgi:hypothetical protein
MHVETVFGQEIGIDSEVIFLCGAERDDLRVAVLVIKEKCSTAHRSASNAALGNYNALMNGRIDLQKSDRNH